MTVNSRDLTATVEQLAQERNWSEVIYPGHLLGLSEDVTVFCAHRKSNAIGVFRLSEKKKTHVFCPDGWATLALGEGSCGLQCRGCYLVGSYRTMRDPARPVVYTNVDKIAADVARWLKTAPPGAILNAGELFDSWLYEPVTRAMEKIVPLFDDPETNPGGCKLLTCTKSAYTPESRADIRNLIVSYSINAEEAAAVFESRLAPPMRNRIHAAWRWHSVGVPTRFRIDPIILGSGDGWLMGGWKSAYSNLVIDLWRKTRWAGVRFTLGMYRPSRAAQMWARRWGVGVAAPDESLVVGPDGRHRYPEEKRVEAYSYIIGLLRDRFGDGIEIGLCKESPQVRTALEFGPEDASCNCLP